MGLSLINTVITCLFKVTILTRFKYWMSVKTETYDATLYSGNARTLFQGATDSNPTLITVSMTVFVFVFTSQSRGTAVEQATTKSQFLIATQHYRLMSSFYSIDFRPVFEPRPPRSPSSNLLYSLLPPSSSVSGANLWHPSKQYPPIYI